MPSFGTKAIRTYSKVEDFLTPVDAKKLQNFLISWPDRLQARWQNWDAVDCTSNWSLSSKSRFQFPIRLWIICWLIFASCKASFRLFLASSFLPLSFRFKLIAINELNLLFEIPKLRLNTLNIDFATTKRPSFLLQAKKERNQRGRPSPWTTSCRADQPRMAPRSSWPRPRHGECRKMFGKIARITQKALGFWNGLTLELLINSILFKLSSPLYIHVSLQLSQRWLVAAVRFKLGPSEWSQASWPLNQHHGQLLASGQIHKLCTIWLNISKCCVSKSAWLSIFYARGRDPLELLEKLFYVAGLTRWTNMTNNLRSEPNSSFCRLRQGLQEGRTFLMIESPETQ